MLPEIDKPVQAEKRSYHNPGGLQNPLLIMLRGLTNPAGFDLSLLISHFSFPNGELIYKE